MVSKERCELNKKLIAAAATAAAVAVTIKLTMTVILLEPVNLQTITGVDSRGKLETINSQ